MKASRKWYLMQLCLNETIKKIDVLIRRNIFFGIVWKRMRNHRSKHQQGFIHTLRINLNNS